MISDVIKQNDIRLLNSATKDILDAVKRTTHYKVNTKLQYIFFGKIIKYIEYGISTTFYDHKILEKQVLPELQKLYPDIYAIKFSDINEEWSEGIRMRVYIN